MVLMLRILLSNKKILEMGHVPKMELGIRNWNSNGWSLIGIFKYAKVRGRNKKQELECPSGAFIVIPKCAG